MLVDLKERIKLNIFDNFTLITFRLACLLFHRCLINLVVFLWSRVDEAHSSLVFEFLIRVFSLEPYLDSQLVRLSHFVEVDEPLVDFV